MTTDQIWNLLRQLMDPELPVVSVVDLGIVRGVETTGDGVIIRLTPTFTGCPAYHAIVTAVRDLIKNAGVQEVRVDTVFAPAWSTDWITPEGRSKLREFGISIGARHGGNLGEAIKSAIECPYCGGEDTVMKNAFGSTRCRSICFCRTCNQPFEWMKPL